MEMPKPTAEHQKLVLFAGSWVGEEILYPSPWSPEQREAIGRFENRMGVDGMFLVADYEEEREGKVMFRGHGVYGFDTRRGKYTMFWFDSMGFSPAETLGVWEGNRLVFTNNSDHGHGRYSYEIHDGDRYTFTIENSRDGVTWNKMMEGHYRRRS